MMWPSLHRPSLRHAAIAITLLGCAGLAAAAQSEFGHRMMAAADRAEVSAMDETTGSIGTRIPKGVGRRRSRYLVA